jgi:hypothetical protein
VTALLLTIATHAAILTLLLAAAAGAGTLVLRNEPFALRCATGLALWAHALFALALVDWLKPWPILALLTISLIALSRQNPQTPKAQPHLLVIAAPLFTAMFLLALQPPLAFDETCYHLPFVRELAQSGALRFAPELRFPAFPQLHELLCVPAYLLGGDTATHLVALLEIVIAALLLLAWDRDKVAAALFLGSPIVVHVGTITYAEAALVLFVIAGFYCLDRERFLLAGLFLGTACSVKYLGGYFAVAALALLLFRRKGALHFALACAAAALPTTLWLFFTTGNPVFPFFGSSAWNLPLADADFMTRVVKTLRVPWDVTFARDQLNQQPPFTPFFIPLLVACVRSPMFVLAALYLAAFSFLPQDSRYLVPLIPLLAIAARWNRKVIAVLAIVPGLAYAGYRLSVMGLPPATPEQRRAVLEERIPAFKALQHVRGPAYACGAEHLKYYAPSRFLGDHNGPFAFDRVKLEELPSMGIETLLIAKRACVAPPHFVLVYDDGYAQVYQTRPRAR